MRANAPKILFLAPLLVTGAALFAPVAQAKQTKPHHAQPVAHAAAARTAPATHAVAAARESAHSRSSKNTSSRVREVEEPVSSRHSSKVERVSAAKAEPKSRRELRESRSESVERVEVDRHSRKGRHEQEQPTLTRVHGRVVELERSHDSRRPAPSMLIPVEEPRRHSAGPVRTASLSRAPEPVREPEPLRAAAEPTPELPAQPEVHVSHNRKLHHTASGVEPSDELAPNSPVAAPAGHLESGVSHPDTDDETAPRVRSAAVAVPAVQPVQLPSQNQPQLHAVAPKNVVVASVVRPVAAAPRPQPQPVAVEEETPAPEILPALYNKRGRLIMPPPLKGSHEILLRQNEVADREGLDRVRDDEDLRQMREAHILVALPENEAIYSDERLPANRRFVRPWTAQFLSTLARAHYARFHTPLQVNSAVRTVEFQQKLMRVNGNAAPPTGDTASPHLTGQAVDLAKHGLSMTEIAWMRGYLLPLVQEGKVDVEEEFQQSCFHISVYKKYLPSGAPAHRGISRRSSATALATAIR